MQKKIQEGRTEKLALAIVTLFILLCMLFGFITACALMLKLVFGI